MQAAWTWLGQNWLTVALVALGLVQVINKATDRWDISASSKGKRLLLLLAELLSVVVSKDFRGKLGLFKLPLNPYGGTPTKLRAGPSGGLPPGSHLLLLVALGGCVLATDGCAVTWRDSADKSIQAAHEMAKGGWDAARVNFQRKCANALHSCDRSAPLADCKAYQSCKGSRRNFATAFSGVQELIAQATDALAAFDRIDVGKSVNLTAERAEVQERINRADRGAVELVRKLDAEGLTQ